MNETTRADVVDEVSKWAVGLGMITMVLFPLAIPILLLTGVALLPLLVPVIALGLIVAVLAPPVLLARNLGRRAVGALRSRRAASESRDRESRGPIEPAARELQTPSRP